MKKLLLTLTASLSLAMVAGGADSYFGLKGSTNALHAETNYFLAVLGDGTNAVIRKTNPTNTVEILKGQQNWNAETTALLSGTGGALTNYTLLAYQTDRYINGFTNVSIRAVMGYNPGRPSYWNVVITNGSGTSRTLEFSAVTNRWRFAGTYGTNAPNTLTNNTALLLSGRSDGTNTLLSYSYFAWP